MLEGQAFEHGIERLELFRQREEALCQQAQRGCQRLQHRCVAQRAQACAVGNAFSSLCFQKTFADVLWRAYQQRSQLIDSLRLGLDGAAASNGNGSHRFGRSRLLFGNRRCFSCEDRSRSVFRVGRIGFSSRSTCSSIGTIDLEHLDLVIAQHAGQARAISAGPFNASAAQTTKRIRPGQQFEISRRVGRDRQRSEELSCFAYYCPDMRIKMRVDAENDFVLFHAYFCRSGRIANPTRRTGHSRCSTKLLSGNRR
ncbi:hypothetical protein WJ60_03870 [Burkholderia ubonensis]|nr:hypothetical protein WJ60_03870 [Burkholderia ubonensis]